jgi:hypothetical protein
MAVEIRKLGNLTPDTAKNKDTVKQIAGLYISTLQLQQK